MLYLIGLGLNDENDLSLKAVDALKNCDEIYTELYTSPWKGNLKKIEKMVGKKIQILARENVESNFIIERAKSHCVALLIPGDPLSATTHIDLMIRAKEDHIEIKIIHASSVYTAVAETGLHLYKFGRATTLAWPKPNFFPTSPYEVILENKKIGLHTLILLDIGEKPMRIADGLKILIEIENKVKKNDIKNETKVVACAALGSDNQIIKYETVGNLISENINESPACIIIPGKLNFQEEEALKTLCK